MRSSLLIPIVLAILFLILSIQSNKFLRKLKEAQDALAEAQSTIAEQAATLAKLQEDALLRDARDFVNAAIVEADLPDMTQKRLARELAANPPVEDGKLDKEAYKATIDKAVEEAQAEIAAVTGSDGKITGQGSTQEPPAGPTFEESQKRQADNHKSEMIELLNCK